MTKGVPYIPPMKDRYLLLINSIVRDAKRGCKDEHTFYDYCHERLPITNKELFMKAYYKKEIEEDKK